MAATTSPKPSDRPEADEPPPLPPEERFWQKYSPHYEFPIANVASIALHVGVFALAIYIVTQLLPKKDDKPAVPVRGMLVKNDSAGGLAGDTGGGGAEHKEAADNETPQDPKRTVPEAELKKELITASAWLPEMKDNPDGLKRIIESPGYDKLRDLNDDLKKRLAQGVGGTKGKGDNPGAGAGKDPGPGAGGPGGPGDATSSGNRSMRWVIVFKTASGKDYLEQLNAFQAKIVVPEPPDWKKNLLFEDIVGDNPVGKPLRDQDLPEMYFKDEDRNSAAKVAAALGLNHKPPYFIAFFPKEIENELATKERSYRNRKEEEIYSTTFRVLNRDGRYVITVTDQVPVRK
jgi:hypothetical protein